MLSLQVNIGNARAFHKLLQIFRGGAAMSNYYDVLGVARDASEKDIRQAYRRLARQYHPDVNKSDAEAEARFKEINEAYGVLSDADSRQKYDRFGDNWRQAGQYNQAGPSSNGGMRWTVREGDDVFSAFGGGGSIFEEFFNSGASPRSRGAWRAPPAEHPVEVTLEEAFHGTTRTVRTRNGRNLEVKIPAGVDNGSRVHISPDGAPGSDFYLVVTVWDHPRFKREGLDLHTEVELPLDDAVLGTEILAPTLTGQVALTVPPNTPNERRFRLSGKGMPALSGSGHHGDLYVAVKVRVPTNLTEEEVDLFRRLRDIRLERSAINDGAAA